MKFNLSVALAINDGYTKMAIIVLDSLLSCCQEATTYECYLLNYQLAQSSRDELEAFMQKHPRHTLTFLNLSDEDYQELSRFPSNHMFIWSFEAFFRIYLPKYLPNHQRVLYLDADIIVNADLSHLADIDLTGKAIAATQEIATLSQYTSVMRGLYRLTLLLKGAVSEQDRKQIFSVNSINSGVLLMNLDFWREKNLLERCLEIIKMMQQNIETMLFAPNIRYEYSLFPPDILFPDQDIINYLTIVEFPGAICHLPTSYNVRTIYNPHLYLADDRPFDDSVLDLNQIAWRGAADALVEVQGVVFDRIQIVHLAGVRPWLAKFAKHPITPFFRHYADKAGLPMQAASVNFLKIFKKGLKMMSPYGLIYFVQLRKKQGTR